MGFQLPGLTALFAFFCEEGQVRVQGLHPRHQRASSHQVLALWFWVKQRAKLFLGGF